MRNLPGADKYRTPTTRAATGDAPWQDPVVVKANTEVPIVDLLNGYYQMQVPAEAEGWKTRCPYAEEHDDGGIDRQFRIYSTSNSGHCFALHGTLDPVRLWRMRSYFPTLKDAAQDLLRAFGIEYRPRPYWERMKALRDRPGFVADPAALVQAVNVFLAAQPEYEARQYEETVLRVVNWTLGEVHYLCGRAENREQVEQWLAEVKQRLRLVLTERS